MGGRGAQAYWLLRAGLVALRCCGNRQVLQLDVDWPVYLAGGSTTSCRGRPGLHVLRRGGRDHGGPGRAGRPGSAAAGGAWLAGITINLLTADAAGVLRHRTPRLRPVPGGGDVLAPRVGLPREAQVPARSTAPFRRATATPAPPPPERPGATCARSASWRDLRTVIRGDIRAWSAPNAPRPPRRVVPVRGRVDVRLERSL